MTEWHITYTFQCVTGEREIGQTYVCLKYGNIHDAIGRVEKQIGKYLISIDEVIRKGEEREHETD
ncbi:hypothetical protein DUK53_14505 [Listeria sp. SHR_NRA_18]|uniref:hypothetical protein n=1 Tax=Listeria sp. SHR_NRA_18 TaxID=2269046 RepID=UPI00051DE855|nr:hypothetical protein [Listeria sp. SHR_NRA_18]KGL46024.1 hypothetical protein EP56_02810 [Listeriaceae bacterium FSL A5-0209]KGL46215.1 hypothetical protein EP56_02090 [Listeriaceae bacterium FSL A5-0209]RQW65822.1 hypothetical protein DUK53_14505 [Listeria sp. SHR_NRA_18]